MPAILVRLVEWILGIFATSLISKIKAYIEERQKKKKAAEELKAKVAQEVQKLEKAGTKEEFDEAAKNLMDHF